MEAGMREFKNVKEYIKENNMIEKNDSVIVGLSGGADSVCLLDMLSKLKTEYELDITAVHVHHGIRGEEADRDMEFAKKVCRERDIKIRIFYYDVPKYAEDNGMSEEEAGRKLRYEAFECVRTENRQNGSVGNCQNNSDQNGSVKNRQSSEDEQSVGNGKIAVAHNRNDNAETFLHNLCRGSGLKGLTGIKPVNGHIIRPLLCLERSEIEQYLKENKILYIEDSTNFNEIYMRNKIRLNVLPYLKENVNEESILHICSASQELDEAERYLEKQTKDLYNQIFFEHNNCIYADKKQLGEIELYMRRRVIRLAIYNLVGKLKDITRCHIADVLALLNRQSGRYIMLPYGIIVQAEQKNIVFKAEDRDISGASASQTSISVLEAGVYEFENYTFEFQILDVEKEGMSIDDFEKDLKNNQKLYTKCFDYGKINFIVQLRHRQTGDYIAINSDGGRKKLKSYMIDEKIPADLRDKLPVITDGQHIMWLFGYRMSEQYKVTSDTRKILIVTGKDKSGNAGQNQGTN